MASRRSDRREDRLLKLVAYAITAALLGGMLLAAIDALAKPRVVPRGTSFPCTPTAVWDGDGPIWCAEGPRLRLAGINARELDGSCRPRAPCVATSGIAARDGLVNLLGGPAGVSRQGHVLVRAPALSCTSEGADRFQRTLANCTLGRRDVGRSLIDRHLVAGWKRKLAEAGRGDN